MDGGSTQTVHSNMPSMQTGENTVSVLLVDVTKAQLSYESKTRSDKVITLDGLHKESCVDAYRQMCTYTPGMQIHIDRQSRV